MCPTRSPNVSDACNAKKEAGFSLVELLIAFAILTVAMLASASMLHQSINKDQTQMNERNAQRAAMMKMEAIRSLGFLEYVKKHPGASPNTTLGTDNGTVHTDFQDRDTFEKQFKGALDNAGLDVAWRIESTGFTGIDTVTGVDAAFAGKLRKVTVTVMDLKNDNRNKVKHLPSGEKIWYTYYLVGYSR
ncbi:MAG: prepilin-type N-terminal cleavage/methylation domain-containing protein [Pseudomonadota bacterium]